MKHWYFSAYRMIDRFADINKNLSSDSIESTQLSEWSFALCIFTVIESGMPRIGIYFVQR